MNKIDKMLGNIIGKKKTNNKVLSNFRLKQFGGKNDLDFDGVQNRMDCQPRNTMRQDNINRVKEKFFYVNSIKTANIAVRLWGWKNLNDFIEKTGYDFNDLNFAFFEISTRAPAGVKIYSAQEVKASYKPILLITGSPSRLHREKFNDYMSMYYRIDGNVYNNK